MSKELTNFTWLIQIIVLKFLGWYNEIPLKRFHNFFNLKKTTKKINIVHYLDYIYLAENDSLSQQDIKVLKFFNNIQKFFNFKLYILIDDQSYKLKYKNKELLDKMFRNNFKNKIDEHFTNYIWEVNSNYLRNKFDYKTDYDARLLDLLQDYINANDMRYTGCDFLVDINKRFPVIKYHFDNLMAIK